MGGGGDDGSAAREEARRQREQDKKELAAQRLKDEMASRSAQMAPDAARDDYKQDTVYASKGRLRKLLKGEDETGKLG